MALEHILALTDLSPESCNGLALAESLARRFHARVTVGFVHTRLDILREFSGADAENATRLREWVRQEDDEQLHALALKYIEKLRLAGVETVEDDSARTGVGALVDRVKPDLVCMATRGRTGLKSVLLGSVAEHTIRTSHKPVVITRTSRFAPHDRPMRVMLGLDLVDEPEPLARRVAKMLTPDDELILAHVVESMFLSLSSYGSHLSLPQPDVPKLELAAREQLERIRLDANPPRVRVETAVGRPGDQLLQLEKDHQPDLIVTRTHGLRGFDHLMLGSVSERLARRADAPLLVFPRLD